MGGARSLRSVLAEVDAGNDLGDHEGTSLVLADFDDGGEVRMAERSRRPRGRQEDAPEGPGCRRPSG